ncbi:erythromycin esterase family protein [Arundinibacter roseus]|uniref:Erythromycin esterase family protein n=1 Tax=Arundinibacter roseus TaxID=2070510 RepID=A0A4R4K5P7_9BACT|nr:erythromycin esterase family protein [Arundinibacter roseus]TDB62798.1 erythromycin esterase family protein [Arundinibacter roseus]
MKRLLIFTLSIFIITSCTNRTVRSQSGNLLETLKEENFQGKTVALSTLDPAAPFTDLQWLNTLWQNKQIIGVGEASHGTSEFYLLRHRLLAYAVQQHDVRTLALEIHFAAGQALNYYIKSGTGDLKQILQNSGYWIYTTQEFAVLINWMKAYNVGKASEQQLSIYGVDAQPQGAKGSVSALRDFFKINDPMYLPVYDDLTKSIAEGFPEFSAVTSQQEAMKLAPAYSQLLVGKTAQIQQYLTQKQAQFAAAPGYTIALKHAQVLLLGMTQIGLTDPDDGLAFRDENMSDNVAWVSTQAMGTKVMVLAHNGHINTNRSTGIRKEVSWMGNHLRKKFGAGYYATGFLFNEGSFRVSGPAGLYTAKVKPKANSPLTQAFAGLGQNGFFFDVAAVNQSPGLKAIFEKEYFFTAQRPPTPEKTLPGSFIPCQRLLMG